MDVYVNNTNPHNRGDSVHHCSDRYVSVSVNDPVGLFSYFCTRITSHIVLKVVLLVLLFFTSKIFAYEDSFTQNVKRTGEYTILLALPPADTAIASCRTVPGTFIPTTRSVDFDVSSEPPHTRDPFIDPTCPFRGGSRRDYTLRYGQFNPRSLNDLGTYRVRCTLREMSITSPDIISPMHCWDGVDQCGNGPPTCAPERVRAVEDYYLNITVENDPPVITSVSHDGTNVLPTGAVAYNGNINVSARVRDPDGGTPTISWAVLARPSGSRATVGSLSNPSLNIQFVDESDFGDWRLQAIATDNEGERIRRVHIVNVVNQEPEPVISGDSRVPYGTDIILTVSPDEDGGDYTHIQWEAFPPSGTGWAVMGGVDLRLMLPTDIAAVGAWRFRVSVTDNESPPMTGTSIEYAVEVYNSPPEITLDPVTSPVLADGGEFTITASASDPDGGDVTLSIRTMQVPNTAPEARDVGSDVVTAVNTITYHHVASSADAGTWIFEVTATDDEPIPIQGTAEPVDAVVLIDALPTVEIDGPERIGILTGMLSLAAIADDPDSPCVTEANRCHSTVDSSPVRDISPGIVRYAWTLVDATLDSGEYFPTGDVRDVFGIAAGSDSIEVPNDRLEPGQFTFQIEVEDGEGNIGTDYHEVLVVEENTNPIALVSPPRGYLLSPLGLTNRNILVSGAYSFDPDNILTDTLPGIDMYNWSVIAGPPGCIPLDTTSILRLYSAGARVPDHCQDVFKLRLTVTDDDEPTAHTDSAGTALVLSTCPGVCIFLPTRVEPSIIEFAENTDVLILYHVSPSVRAAFLLGMFARLDIFHESDRSVPVFTSFSPNLWTSELTSLLAFHWDGHWSSQRPRPGRYSVEISLVDHALTINPLYKVRENDAILIEVDELNIASDADRYVSLDAMKESTDSVSIDFAIDGSIVPDRIEWRLINDAGSEIDGVGGTVIPALSGTINWDGQLTGRGSIPRDFILTGHYIVEIEAFKDSRSLTGRVRHPLTVYELRLQPVSGPPDLVVLHNTDDDNHNGHIDKSESGRLPGEDDLLAVNIVFNPVIKGQLTFSTTDTSPRVKLYAAGDRLGGETPFPLNYDLPSASIPDEIYLEGVDRQNANLVLDFDPVDAPALPSVEQTVEVIDIALEDSSFTPVNFVDIATWADAYRPAIPLPVRNNLSDNFVDREARRFYVRVKDPALNSDSGRPETGQAQIWTIKQDGTVYDDPTRITLFERNSSGSGTNDENRFQSNAQILVTSDFAPLNQDDDFRAHDGISSRRNDDATNDRTHRTHGIDSAVKVTYRHGSGRALDFTKPVCRRNPESRRTVNIRATIFNDPNGGSIPIADDVELYKVVANSTWAHACIKFNITDVRTEDAPTRSTPIGPVNILADGEYDWRGTVEDETALFAAYTGDAQIDRIELFIVPHIPGANGLTYPALTERSALSLKVFSILSFDTLNNRTFSHEMGHALTNKTDIHGFTYLNFPHKPWEVGDPLPRYPYSLDASGISQNRRILEPYIGYARTDRAQSHAVPGDLSSTPPPSDVEGNYVLKRP